MSPARLMVAVIALGLLAGPVCADDAAPDPAEPDFTVITLPTTLRLPRYALAFRLTHRFSRGFERGSFGDLAGDLFGFDGGAQVGLGLRFAPLAGSQFTVYRTSDKTIEFNLWQDLLQQRAGHPLSLAATGGVEGLDNFGADYSPNLGLVVSRRLGRRGAVYAVPRWVGHTNLTPAAGEDEASLVLGLGARVGLGHGMSLLAEGHPVLAGWDGGPNGAPLLSFAFEEQVGGHSFQINVSNDLGTTPAQVARGRTGRDDWFLGFNLSRKFF